MRLPLRTPSLALGALGALLTPHSAGQTPVFGDHLPVGNLQFLGAFDLAAIDVDADGDLDLYATSGGTVLAFENNGFAGFAPALVLASNQDSPLGLEAADLDGDGDLDLVYCSRFGNEIRWLECTGTGNAAWSGPVAIAPLVGAWDLSVKDMDNDGDEDIVATSHDADLVVWIEQTQLRVFAAPSTVASGVTNVTEVETADFNGDGRQDIVVAAVANDRVQWYRNLGAGTFGPAQVLTTAVDDPWSISVADLDDNGWIDVMSASYGDGKFAWYRNQGSGVFSAQQVIDIGVGGARDIEAVDVDQDGKCDVVGTASGPGGIRYYPNVGSGFFGAPVPMPNHAGSPTVARALDIDGDFDIDFVHGDGFWNPNITELGNVFVLCANAAVPNSSGQTGKIVVSGNPSAGLNSIALTALDLPMFQFGFFLVAPTTAVIPNPGGSQGVLCLTGGIGRYNDPSEIQFTGPLTSARLRLDLTQTPTPTGPTTVTAGQTWHFQAWHRDTVNGQPTSNFTNAVSMLFQ